MEKDKRIIVSISIRKLREDHMVTMGLPPNVYAFKDVLRVLAQQWRRKSVHIAKDRKINAREYAAGSKTIHKRYKCSFADAERLIIEQSFSEKLRK